MARNMSSLGVVSESSVVDRRTLLAGSLAAGACLPLRSAMAQVGPLHCVPPLPTGQPVAFKPPTSGPVRVRKSVFELDAQEISKLKRAYKALRDLTGKSRDDARGWFHQGQAHCWYCSGAEDGLNGQEIHGGWWFLPWHRAYLYFHEQILGSLIGAPDLALPYWDWDSPGRDRFPSDIYGKPGETGNPLYDAKRGIKPTDRIPDTIVGTKVMQRVLGASSFADFGGSSDEGRVDPNGRDAQMGGLEGGPHGGVHLWVSDPINFSGAPDMGSLGTAGFDPVFFAHHANIDRLWDVWLKSGTARANPAVQRWTSEQIFYFYDAQPKWTAISVEPLVDHETSLRYRYMPPQHTGTPVASMSRTVGSSPQVAQAAPLGAPLVELSPNQEAKPLSASPTTVEVPLPQQTRAAIQSLAAPASAKTLVLRIDGVEIPADRGAAIKVFVNRPDATAATGADDPGFVGSIFIVPSTAAGAGGMQRTVHRNFGFDITQDLASALEKQGNLSVTLVPFTGDGRQPDQVALRYKRVYIAPR